jgi:beta-glucosidase-like glycosyl hydrolase
MVSAPDGPRGVVCEKSTCFPVTMGRGATFDTELEEKVGEAVAKEIRAYGGVCINLPYNPGRGRSQGTYCGQQKYLLSDVLKKEWDFDGFVVSDFVWGTRDTVNAANAGLDVEISCPVEKLSYYSESGWKVERDIDYVGYIGTSSFSRDLTALKFSL